MGWLSLSNWWYVCQIRGLCEPSGEVATTEARVIETPVLVSESGNTAVEEDIPVTDKIDNKNKEREVEIAAIVSKVSETLVTFQFDDSRITDQDDAQNLTKILQQLQSFQKPIKLTITGHTCNIGSDEYNKKLGMERARSMKDYLISQNLKIDIQILSAGESLPRLPNTSEANRSQNRRVEFRVQYLN